MLDIHHLPGSTLQESKITILRAHWITLIPVTLSTLIVLLLPFLGYIGFQQFNPELFAEEWRFTLYVLGASIFFLYGLLFCFQTFIDYWLDVFIVTDKRVLDIEQSGLFSRTVSELRMYRIQDVTAEVKGFIHTIFDYGNIHIQTAGEKQRFEFIDVAHPNQMAKMIIDMSEADRKEHLEEAVEDFGMPDTTIPPHEHVAKKMEP